MKRIQKDRNTLQLGVRFTASMLSSASYMNKVNSSVELV